MKKIINYVNENPGCSYRDVIINTDSNHILITELLQNGDLIEVRYHLENQHSERTGLLFPKNTSIRIIKNER
jgi:hypothetical protein